jgi:ribosomal protein L11 methylase PrmA
LSFSLVVTAPEEELELLAALLFDEGALGVEVQDREVQLMPGTEPLPQGRGRCIAHFEGRPAAEDAAAALRSARPGLEIPDPLEVAEQDWSVAWRVHHKPPLVGTPAVGCPAHRAGRGAGDHRSGHGLRHRQPPHHLALPRAGG